MDSEIVEQILDELDPIFKGSETAAAIVQFLKDKKIATDAELAPYLEQAATAGSVKWRATRLRLARLLEAAEKSIEKSVQAGKKEETKNIVQPKTENVEAGDPRMNANAVETKKDSDRQVAKAEPARAPAEGSKANQPGVKAATASMPGSDAPKEETAVKQKQQVTFKPTGEQTPGTAGVSQNEAMPERKPDAGKKPDDAAGDVTAGEHARKTA